ncbi:MAG: AAA family ATPase [Candidatus Uhrbacteria bacterium]|nr:AAA family ATPase [Candidatus Uhrbacteria bacterium]
MYLKRMELQGFKTFAQKTVLEFVLDKAGRRGITAIVGPNGSGKSNIADAIRWVMGEQSLKLLRGKKSEDVIFSGSDRRARSGFSEVTLTIENDSPSLELRGAGSDLPSEVSITRRLYRDGQSNYEINRQTVRLQDVVMLLAQCGIGQRTYSVIAQGMVDQILVASPTERKEFFDEAFGLKSFQLKRQSALNKIEHARENLGQTEALLREIEPRLQSLSRQMKRLEQRDQVETELKSLEQVFYGHGWLEISQGLTVAAEKLKKAKAAQAEHGEVAHKLEADLAKLEKAAPASQGFRELQKSLEGLMKERGTLRERELKLEAKHEVAAARAEKTWSPLPLSKIIESVEMVRAKHEALDDLLKQKQVDLAAVRQLVGELRELSREFIQRLQRPAPEVEATIKSDPVLEKELKEAAEALTLINQQVTVVEAKLELWNQEEQKERKHIFDLQHQLNRARQDRQTVDERASEAAVELARFETRRDGFLVDLRQHAPQLESGLDKLQATSYKLQADMPARLQKLRSQLEWIGSIDPETVKEHEETKTRHEFLRTQTDDLRQSIQGLEIVITELDTTIRERSEKAFHELDREFGIFFKKLFQGGEAKLIEVLSEPEVDEAGNAIEQDQEEQGFSGIEIQATAPGKRFKAIALLSGGERALTSIALICAIMATNPSPFVVLDEVDAALDESNSRKFAEIIDSLADKTQFIVVTHNRATMTQSNVLYGVTMGDDGVSQLLSVKMDDVERMRR